MIVLVVVVSMSFIGRSQTPIICLESISTDERYTLCVSPRNIEQAFKNASVETCKIVENEEGYIKYCFFKVTEGDFSQIMLVSQTMRDPNGKAECVYMELFYGNKILYLPEKDKKTWWQATNLLNNAKLSSTQE